MSWYPHLQHTKCLLSQTQRHKAVIRNPIQLYIVWELMNSFNWICILTNLRTTLLYRVVLYRIHVGSYKLLLNCCHPLPPALPPDHSQCQLHWFDNRYQSQSQQASLGVVGLFLWVSRVKRLCHKRLTSILLFLHPFQPLSHVGLPTGPQWDMTVLEKKSTQATETVPAPVKTRRSTFATFVGQS